MKIFAPGERRRAFTLIEMFVVVVCVAVLAAIFLPALARRKAYPSRASCQNNLKQVGLAFRTWDGDYNGLYPMSYYTNGDGTMKYADSANFFRYFQAMSNELNNPKILVCPMDSKRTQSVDFGGSFSARNVSYFIGLDADEKYATRLLAGDGNLVNGMQSENGILNVTTNQTVGWTRELHNGAGNILFSDGSVEQVDAKLLKEILAKTGLATNRLGMP